MIERTKNLKFEELAQLEGQMAQLVLGQQQFPQLRQIPDLRWEAAQPVGRRVQALQVHQVADLRRQLLQLVVIDKETRQVLVREQLRTQDVHFACNTHTHSL